MMTRGWFGPKRFGLGIGPRRWQGWLATVLFAVALPASIFLLRHTAWGQARWAFLSVLAGLIAVFLAVVVLTYDGGA